MSVIVITGIQAAGKSTVADALMRLIDPPGEIVSGLDGIGDPASLPILLPVRWSGYSPAEFHRTMRARLEVFQADAP